MNSMVQNPSYQAGMEARFAIAARHSRMVRILRIAVPAAVALSMAAIVGISIFNPFRMLLPKLPVDMDNLAISGTKITMETPHMMEDRSTLTLDAVRGLFDNKQQTLDLHKDIFLQTTTGYEARLSQAFVDLGKNTVTSEEHVDVKLTNGTLSSDRLRITGGGEVVRFEGNVVMHLDHLMTNDAAQADGGASPEPMQSGRARAPSGKSASAK